MVFAWDPAKAASNRRKHGTGFPEAATVLYDPFAMTFPDDSIADETRFVSIGRSNANRVLVVVHTDRGNVIRLISARRATRSERKFYEENQS